MPKVTRSSGANDGVEALIVADWKMWMGEMMWSAVRTAKEASGSRHVEDGGREADSVGGVAAHGFAEELVGGEEGEVGEDLVGVSGTGADVDVVRVDEVAEACGGDLQEGARGGGGRLLV